MTIVYHAMILNTLLKTLSNSLIDFCGRVDANGTMTVSDSTQY